MPFIWIKPWTRVGVNFIRTSDPSKTNEADIIENYDLPIHMRCVLLIEIKDVDATL